MRPVLNTLLEPYRTVALVGMCKNAGKTTVLNRCIRAFEDTGDTLALTSIGRDGEDTDVVTGTAKPGIYVRAGTLLATAAGLLPHCDITREILESTGLSTPLGEVVLLRALSDGQVQLGGPSIISQLATLRDAFFRHGASRVFVDGALSRKTLSTRSLSDGTILCTGASCGGGMGKVVDETAYFCTLALLPTLPDEPLRRAFGAHSGGKLVLAGRTTLYPGATQLHKALQEHPDNGTHTVFIEGALTDAVITGFIRSSAGGSGLALVVRDASKLLLSQPNYTRLLAKGASLYVLDSVNLVAVTVNPFSAYGAPFPPAAFRQAMADAVPLPVLDVEEQQL